MPLKVPGSGCGSVLGAPGKALAARERSRSAARAAAARAYGLIRPDEISEESLAVTGTYLEEEAPPFDVEAGASQLREAAHDRGLLSGSASKPSVEQAVSSRLQDGHTVVTICGEIDLYTAPRLHRELARLLAEGMPARVVIDMSGVEFCDSTGLNVLLSFLRRVRERGGELEIASPTCAVRKILRLTGLDSVFTLVDAPTLGQPKHAVPRN